MLKNYQKNNSKINGVFNLVGRYTVEFKVGSDDMTQKQMIAQMYKDIIAMKQDILDIKTRIDNIVKKNNLKE